MSDEKYHARIRADFKRVFAEARAKRAPAKKITPSYPPGVILLLTF